MAESMNLHPLLDPKNLRHAGDAPDTPGIYALLLDDPDQLSDIDLPESGLLYVGMSGKLSGRDHFHVRHSGFSSPRRTLGALLKARLDLRAEPRDWSGRNFASYRFSGHGEAVLAEWMAEHLRLAVHSEQDANATERDAIRALQPPLNLKGWANPQKSRIMECRRACADEARRLWTRHLAERA